MNREQAEREATEWLLLLQEEPDEPGLRARFDAWLAASPLHESAWAATAQAYDLIGEAMTADAKPGAAAASPFTSPSASARSRVRRSGERRPVRRPVAIGAAAAAVAACLLFVVFLPGLVLQLRADYVTGTGEQREVRLPDGSLVALGPESAVEVDYAGRDRRVRLLAGRAYFEVTYDRSHPFEVSAKGVSTTVLGTGFDVRLEPGGAAVAVRHGAVQVGYAEAEPPVSRRLGAGDWLRVGWRGEVAAGEEPPEQVDAWRRGQLIARDRSVADVVDELRSYYPGVIVLTNEALGRLRVTGVYDLHEPVRALRALAQAHSGVAIHRISPWLLVLSGG